MAIPPHDKLPPELRKKFFTVQDASGEREKLLQASLRLIYDTTIYLASIALSAYRHECAVPDLVVERQVASLTQSNLRRYMDLFRKAAAKSDDALCALRDPGQMTFRTPPKLQAAMNAADRARDAKGSVLSGLYAEECANAREWYDLEESFNVIRRLRNRGYGHLEESGWDGIDDYFDTVAELLRDAALELLGHPDVAHVLEAWYPARVVRESHDDGRHAVEVRPFGEDVPAVSLDAGTTDVRRDSIVLVHEGDDGPELHGRYLSLFAESKPAALADEALSAAIDEGRYRQAVAATREEFLDGSTQQLGVSRQVVDDLLVMVLEEFKVTAAPLDVDVLVGRLDHLLDWHSPELPARVIRDIDYFAMLATHARGYPPLARDRDELLRLAWHGPRTSRGRAIAALGRSCDPAVSEELERIVREEPRSELRKHALLAIGRVGAPGAFDLLRDTAMGHRRHPAVATFALRALSGRPDAKAANFLAGYLAGGAPYACLNAAAWSLAEIFNDSPHLAEPWIDRLLDHIRTLEDPYTRGCLMFALAMTRRRDVASRIVGTVWPFGDVPEDPYVLEDACLAAGLLADPETLPFLTACAQPEQPDPLVRRQAIVALRRLDTAEAHRVLLELPPASEPYVRRAQDPDMELPRSPFAPPREPSAKDAG